MIRSAGGAVSKQRPGARERPETQLEREPKGGEIVDLQGAGQAQGSGQKAVSEGVVHPELLHHPMKLT